ncbi:2-oxo acid dehydrogenase subunit E2 [Cryptosporangium minutisporangium]|uniref:Dihydrolipoyllysine-residue succinyltransferase component of 2-oxoglutarate dehydrogenase complex n=1 Tax=Cryptosporangium minutisporangium TaxID=113569 RepID=A0ABP6SU14_9ACTN
MTQVQAPYRERMTRMRKIIATRMVESLQTSAQLTSVVEADVSGITEARRRTKDAFRSRHGVGLSYLPFFALAAVQALAEHRVVNASVVPETHEIEYHPAQHLGIAVDTERGLMVPVIRDAQELDLAGLAVAIDDVATRTRESKLRPDEGSGGTFTITNTGSRGALFDTPIINAPQSAILGTGAVVRRPVALTDAEGGEWVAIRSMVYLALSYDHRIVDGADAARFLTDVKRRLEDPTWIDQTIGGS